MLRFTEFLEKKCLEGYPRGRCRGASCGLRRLVEVVIFHNRRADLFSKAARGLQVWPSPSRFLGIRTKASGQHTPFINHLIWGDIAFGDADWENGLWAAFVQLRLYKGR